MNWTDEMLAQPAFQNSVNFEYQFRCNVLIPEAEMIRDAEAKPRPVNEGGHSSAQLLCQRINVKKWEDENDVNFLMAMDMLKKKAGLIE